jgi:hypothetical protein
MSLPDKIPLKASRPILLDPVVNAATIDLVVAVTESIENSLNPSHSKWSTSIKREYKNKMWKADAYLAVQLYTY